MLTTVFPVDAFSPSHYSLSHVRLGDTIKVDISCGSSMAASLHKLKSMSVSLLLFYCWFFVAKRVAGNLRGRYSE